MIYILLICTHSYSTTTHGEHRLTLCQSHHRLLFILCAYKCTQIFSCISFNTSRSIQ